MVSFPGARSVLRFWLPGPRACGWRFDGRTGPLSREMHKHPRSARGGRLAPIAICLALLGCGVMAPPDAGLPIEGVETTGRELPGSLADNPAGPHVELMTG